MPCRLPTSTQWTLRSTPWGLACAAGLQIRITITARTAQPAWQRMPTRRQGLETRRCTAAQTACTRAVPRLPWRLQQLTARAPRMSPAGPPPRRWRPGTPGMAVTCSLFSQAASCCTCMVPESRRRSRASLHVTGVAGQKQAPERGGSVQKPECCCSLYSRVEVLALLCLSR